MPEDGSVKAWLNGWSNASSNEEVESSKRDARGLHLCIQRCSTSLKALAMIQRHFPAAGPCQIPTPALGGAPSQQACWVYCQRALKIVKERSNKMLGPGHVSGS